MMKCLPDYDNFCLEENWYPNTIDYVHDPTPRGVGETNTLFALSFAANMFNGSDYHELWKNIPQFDIIDLYLYNFRNGIDLSRASGLQKVIPQKDSR